MLLLGSFATAGYGAVGADGAFNYNISLDLPAAPSRHRPDLKLVYNSNFPAGLLGHGWGLSGLPVIRRIDFGRGIRFDSADTFAGPDGRLVKVSANEYRNAADNGTVATPLFSGDAKIEGACYVTNGEPCAWQVVDGFGTTYLFGATDDSRIEAFERKGVLKTGRPLRLWAVSSVRDIHGNTYSAHYWKSATSGAFYPREVRYSGARVVFAYCDKASPFECAPKKASFGHYRDGSFVVDEFLLRTISVSPTSAAATTYSLEYDESDLSGPRLVKVSLGDAAQPALRQHRFEWGRGYDSIQDAGAVVVPDGHLEHSNHTVRIHLGDFNGDGRTDILRTWDNQQHRLFLSNGHGFDDAGPVVVPDGHLEHSNHTVRIHLGDFNGDGRTDILRTWDNQQHRLFLSNGHGFDDAGPVVVPDGHLEHSNHTVRIHLGDFNGDGRTDILRTWDNQQHRLFLSNGHGFDDAGPVVVPDGHLEHSNHTVRIHLGDFNGDGRTDILRTWDNQQHRLFLSNGHGFDDAGPVVVPDGHLEHSNHTVRIHLGDFNGDGRTDILRTWDNQQHRLFLSNGHGFDDAGPVVVPDGYLEHSNHTVRIHLGDFNGDGRTDILRTWDNQQHRLFLSNGHGFDDAGPVVVPDGYLEHSNHTVRIHLGDFNGDGRTDILRTWDNQQHRLFVTSGGNVGALDRELSAAAQRLLGSALSDAEPILTSRLQRIIEPDGGEIRVSYKPPTAFVRAIQYDFGCDGGAPGYVTALCGVPSSGLPVVVAAIAESDGRASSGWSQAQVNLDRVDFYTYANSRTYPGERNVASHLGFGSVVQYRAVGVGGNLLIRSTQVKQYEQAAFINFTGSNMQMVRSPFVGSVTHEWAYTGPETPSDKVSETAITFATDRAFPIGSNPEVARALIGSRDTEFFEKGTSLGRKTDNRGYDEYGRLTAQVVCDLRAGGAAECLKTETRYAAWSYGATWPAEQILEQQTSQEANVVSATRLTYSNAARPIYVTQFESLLCTNGSACDVARGRWVTTSTIQRYDSRGQVIQARDENGADVTYEYDEHGLVISHKRTADTLTLARSFKRDPFGRVVMATDENGQTTTYAYDAVGRVTERIDPMGAREEIAYVSAGGPESQYRQVTVTRTVRLDSVGKPLREQFVTKTFFDGWRTEYLIESDSDGLNAGQKVLVSRQIVQVADGIEEKQSLPYFSGGQPSWVVRKLDLSGRLRKIERPDRTYEEYVYKGNQRVVLRNYSNVDVAPDQLARSVEYLDLNGRIERRLDADQGETIYRYDASGRVVEVVLPVDRISGLREHVALTYDSFGRRVRIVDPAAGEVTFAFDTAGNLLERQSKAGTIQYEYDHFGRLVRRTSKEPTASEPSELVSLEYDVNYSPVSSFPVGRPTKVTDAAGVRTLAYNPAGLIVWSSRQLKELGEPFVESFQFSESGDLLAYTYPDGSRQFYEYTRRGNLAGISLDEGRGAQTITRLLGFNAFDRPTSVAYGNGVETSHVYSDAGLLTASRTCNHGCASPQVQDVLQDVAYTFNKMGFISSIQALRMGAAEGTRQFYYDNIGRLNRALVGASPSEMDIGYVYSEIGGLYRRNVSRSQQLVETKLYPHDGERLTGGFSSPTYSAESEFLRITTNDGGLIITKAMRGGPTEPWVRWSYDYDADSRLRKATKLVPEGDLSVEFVYDYMGKRVSKVASAYGSRLTAVWYGAPTFEVRAEGDGGKLVTIKHVIAPLVGRVAVIRRTVPENQFLHPPFFVSRAFASADLLNQAREELMESSNRLVAAVASNVSTLRSADAKPNIEGIFFVHNDHLSSTDLVTDAAGKEWQRLQYGPFGEVVGDNSTVQNAASVISHRFTGYEWDEETGLYYAESRYYDPTLSQFLTPDPIVAAPFSAQSFNRYAYVFNNPVAYRDPNGRFPFIAVIVGAVVGGTYTGIQSHGNVGEIVKGAFIGAVAGSTGAWAGAAVGGGVAGAIAAGGAAGGVSSGLNAAFNNENILEGTLRGAAMGAIGGAITGGLGYGGSYVGVPAFASRAVGAATSCKFFGCSDQAALDQALLSVGTSAVNEVVSPQGGRPLTAGEKRMLMKAPELKGIDLDIVRVYKGGIYTWGGPAVTMDNNITFPQGQYLDDFSLGGVRERSWLAHETFHVYEYQTSDYSWRDAAWEHVRYGSDVYKTPGTHEYKAKQFEKSFNYIP